MIEKLLKLIGNVIVRLPIERLSNPHCNNGELEQQIKMGLLMVELVLHYQLK